MKFTDLIRAWLAFVVLSYATWTASGQDRDTKSLDRRPIGKYPEDLPAGARIRRRKIKRPSEFASLGKNRKSSSKDSRLLSLLTIVQFDNGACAASNGSNGTCMTSSECAARGGVPAGVCAKQFGVCCLFMATCGQITNQNCTYFVNPGYPSPYNKIGSCQLTLQKSHSDVCQYRLDFDQFTLTGPEKANHMCNNDQFIVSGGNPVPAICGVNSGNHIPSSLPCFEGTTNPVTLTVVTSGPDFNRNWKIKICQIPCNSNYKAEDGCLQYYTGVSGQIKTYNYDSPDGQLSNQDYSSCVRTERNFCGIQYSACVNVNNNRSRTFSISGNTEGQNVATSMVGSVGPNSCPNDWVIIPCARNIGRPAGSACVDRICGGTFNSEVSTTESTVYSTVKPFRIAYHTDNVEAPNDEGNVGYCLNYVQQPCTN